jgi:hypothetical protein
MKQPPPAAPRSLLIHDGELADVRALLSSLELPFVERLGAESQTDRQTSWDLVIASARRILELQLSNTIAPPTQIAILAHDARTLRSSLRRSGTTLIVRRPVHPAALRALIVHSLYRGPEKRRSARVNVGAPVRVKLGWRSRPALLVDLSASGCRLMTERPIEPGAQLRLLLNPELTGGKALSVEATVTECTSSRDPSLGRFVTTATFGAMNARLRAQLQSAIKLHLEGPALFEGAPQIPAAASSPTPELAEAELAQPALAEPALAEPGFAEAELAEVELALPGFAEAELAEVELALPGFAEAELAQPALAEPGFAEPELAEPALAESGFAEPALAEDEFAEDEFAEDEFAEDEFAKPELEEPTLEELGLEELNLDERRDFEPLLVDSCVDSLDEEAARVVMGRDLSRNGMRVDPNPLLAVGMNLRLAVHAETREAPMILHAVVDRDDGDLGLELRFRDLSPELSSYLDYVIHALPLVIDDDDDDGCLVAELLEASSLA